MELEEHHYLPVNSIFRRIGFTRWTRISLYSPYCVVRRGWLQLRFSWWRARRQHQLCSEQFRLEIRLLAKTNTGVNRRPAIARRKRLRRRIGDRVRAWLENRERARAVFGKILCATSSWGNLGITAAHCSRAAWLCRNRLAPWLPCPVYDK